MGDHFAAFTFVDCITGETKNLAHGRFAVPAGIREFPACLAAEAVGQLAAWVAMSRLDFRVRPVAALATETRFHQPVHPGDALELGVDIEDCDDDAVAYSGWASVNGARAIELIHCLGPMLPVADFDSPDELRERFALMRAGGSAGGRFPGIDPPRVAVTAHVPERSIVANLAVPARARFFADHFPRNPVFPATLLLDAQLRVASRLADDIGGAQGGKLAPARMTHVKMRSFVTPGQSVEIQANVSSRDAASARMTLAATVEGKSVATARVEFVAGATS